eukprot:gene11755-15729_t
MPLFVLKIKADLENINRLIPLNDNLWTFNIQSSEGGDRRDNITVSSSDVMELEGSKGDANFIIKWPGAKSQSYIKIVSIKKNDGCYHADDSGNFVSILALECRGLEILSWIPGIDFVVESIGGSAFENVDLTDGDWADYDEDNDTAVSVTNLEHVIELG